MPRHRPYCLRISAVSLEKEKKVVSLRGDSAGPRRWPAPAPTLSTLRTTRSPTRPPTSTARNQARISSTQISFPLFSRRGSYLPPSRPELVRHTFFGEVTCGTGLAKELWRHCAARHNDDTYQGEGGRPPTVPFLSCERTTRANPRRPPPNGVSHSPSAPSPQLQRRRL